MQMQLCFHQTVSGSSCRPHYTISISLLDTQQFIYNAVRMTNFKVHDGLKYVTNSDFSNGSQGIRNLVFTWSPLCR